MRPPGGSLIEGDSGGQVYLRDRVGGPAQLVVESPGYRQVIGNATPAVEELFGAKRRGEYSGTAEQFNSEVGRLIRAQLPVTRPMVTAARRKYRRAWLRDWFSARV
jgi:hypothetical protein